MAEWIIVFTVTAFFFGYYLRHIGSDIRSQGSKEIQGKCDCCEMLKSEIKELKSSAKTDDAKISVYERIHR